MAGRKAVVDDEVRHWPVLTFHYGLSPTELKKMPRAVRVIYADALDRLLAEAQLSAVMAAGAPYMKEPDSKRLVEELRARAQGGHVRNQVTLDEFIAMGGGGGLGVQKGAA